MTKKQSTKYYKKSRSKKSKTHTKRFRAVAPQPPQPPPPQPPPQPPPPLPPPFHHPPPTGAGPATARQVRDNLIGGYHQQVDSVPTQQELDNSLCAINDDLCWDLPNADKRLLNFPWLTRVLVDTIRVLDNTLNLYGSERDDMLIRLRNDLENVKRELVRVPAV